MGLPGWSSIQATGAFSSFFFWASIFALVLLGLAEVFSHRYGERHDLLVAQQQRAEKDASDGEMARLHLATAQANERAASAELELTKLKAPRTLSAEQQASITKSLKPFAGMMFAGQTASSVPDSRPLWMVLAKALVNAGWHLQPPWGLSLGDPPAGVAASPNEGITIFVPAESWTALLPSVEALYKSLTAAGLKTVAVADRGDQKRQNIIVIEIGTKPL